ncbi:MAG: response regulator transcription factor [Balneola sp.]|tara:strand:- start:39206 stop:39559 length:354 start_codon:yes stop_codon:yes gene_type:complete
MKIMIVDDHEATRKILRSLILLHIIEPIQFVEYDNGEDAVQNYISDTPDYVLMDVEMKKMDGFEATELILKKSPDAKVIIITSNNTTYFRDRAKEAHSVGFVAKDNLSQIFNYLKFY